MAPNTATLPIAEDSPKVVSYAHNRKRLYDTLLMNYRGNLSSSQKYSSVGIELPVYGTYTYVSGSSVYDVTKFIPTIRQVPSTASTIDILEVVVIAIDKATSHLAKLIGLDRKYLKQKAMYSLYLGTDIDTAETKIKCAIAEVIKLNYKAIALELTPDKGIFFNIKIDTNRTLHLKLLLEPQGDVNKECFYTYYNGDEILAEGFGSFSEVINIVQKFQA